MKWLEHGCRALNEMACCGSREVQSLSMAQVASLDHMLPLYSSAARKCHEHDNLKAFRSIQGGRGGYSADPGCSTGSYAVYRPGDVKLPPKGAGKVKLDSLLPPPWNQWLRDGSNILRADITPNDQRKASNSSGIAFDAQFRSRGVAYGDFLGSLLEHGIIELCDDEDVIGERGM